MKVSSIAVASLAASRSAVLAKKTTTVYLFRHGEQKTTQTVVGNATSPYSVVWNGDEITVEGIVLEEESTAGAKNLDEVCGVARCAEELSDLGLLRARLLGEYLASLGVAAPGALDAAYSSHLHRARQTADPAAALAGLDGVVQLPEGGTELNPEGPGSSVCPTVEAIQSYGAGSTLVVAGHTSTMYEIMGAGRGDECDGLGVDVSDDDLFPKDARGRVPRDQYGNVWIVEIDEDGSASLKERHVLDFAMTATRTVAMPQRPARDGPAVDGTCGFPPSDEAGVRQLYVRDYPDGCGDFVPGASCFPGICEDVDVAFASDVTRQQSSKLFTNKSAWNPADPDGTLVCMHAKGYSFTLEEVEPGVVRQTIHGHAWFGFEESEEGSGEDPAAGIAALKTPGSYYMQGGTFVKENEGCVEVGPGNFQCGGRSAITKAEGKFVDICAELGSKAPTHCSALDSSVECNRVNTCAWSGGGECVYRSPWRTGCGLIKSKNRCGKSDDCKWDDEDGCVDDDGLGGFVPPTTMQVASSKEAAAVEMPNSGFAIAASVWALLPMTMMLWANIA